MTASKGVLWPWFQGAVDGLDAGHRAVMDGWERASEHLNGAHVESWKGWVRQTVRIALTRANANPVGLWLTVLADGPATDITKPPGRADDKRTAHEIRTEETRRQLAAINTLHQGHAPLAYGARAIREGRDPREVYAAWEDAGRPPMSEFPYPFAL